jgi:hypothetical protein
MSHHSSQFDNILLPPGILAGMFSQSLVVIEKHQLTKTNQAPAEKAQPFKGSSILKESTVNTAIADESAQVYVQEKNEKISSLGDFARNILVLVNDPDHIYLGEAELDTLGKMLQALQFSFADIAIVNAAHQKTNWQILQQQFAAKKVVLFGVEPADIQIPVRFPHFRVQNWSNIHFLFSPSLAEINRETPTQKQTKMALWTAIKQLFAAS